jgi:hypothetical protein
MVLREFESYKTAKNHLVKSWAQIDINLPGKLTPVEKKLARQYFRVQLRYSKNQITKGQRIMKGLVKRDGYEQFELNNEGILAAIDLAVKGKTDWEEPPAFRIDRD